MNIDNLALLFSLAAYLIVIRYFVSGNPKKVIRDEKKTRI